MSRQWSKFDEMGLARFVIPGATRWVRLPVNRADLLTRPDGRKRLVEAIYTSLFDAGIRYAPEQYHPELAEQVIRSPSQILASPGEGTCLDLAALFAGLCLGFELLPVVIVTETHALCAVSLTHGASDWDAFDRRERQTFEQPLADPAVLRGLIDNGSFLAVECTGFAHSEFLPADSIEGAGRREGILPFLRATEAGRSQLDRTDSPLRFAIDVAVAHYHWKIIPPMLPPEHQIATEELVAEQFAAGLRLDKAARGLDLHSFPRPVSPLLRPARAFIDRRTELDAVLGGVADQGIAWLTGHDGVGKTELLRRIGHEDRPAEYQDGAVYLSQVKNSTDAAQQVFDSFFDYPKDFKPSVTRIGHSIRGLRALVMVDDSASKTSEGLADLMPAAGLVAVGDEAERGGAVVPMGGLTDLDAADLFAHHLGRIVGPEERPQVVELCRALGGHPARVIDAARDLASGTETLEGLLAASRTSPNGPTQSRYADLDDTEREIVDLLRTFKSAGLLGRHIEAIVPGDVEPALAKLVSSRAVATASPRYRLAATAMGDVVEAEQLAQKRERAVRYFEELAHHATPDELGDSLPEILEVMTWAHSEQRWKTVVALGAAAEGVAAMSRQWGLWGSILETTRAAAVQTGDQPAHAYALHQLGTRARLFGDRSSARGFLKHARRIRRGLGDSAGARLSAHNLGFAKLGWVPWVIGTAVVATLGIGGAVVCNTTDVCEGTPSTTTPTLSPVVGVLSPVVGVSPTEIGFGELSVGAGGLTEAVTVSNDGDVPATLGTAAIEGDDVFSIAGFDCSEVIQPGGSCEYSISFAPVEPDEYEATFVLDIEGGGQLEVFLSGRALEPANVTIDPGVGEFGEVVVGERAELAFALTNNGQEVAAITSGPSVEGAFFSLVSTNCNDSLDPGSSCEIRLLFAPDRDAGAGAEDQIHEGVLAVNTDPSGQIEVPLQGVSTFLLPDLSIEIQEATPISRELVGETDVVMIRVATTVRNGGRGPAGNFRVTAEYGSDGVWFFTAFTDDPTLSTIGSIVDEEILPGGEISYTGYILITRSFLSADASLPVRLLVDSCAGEEFAPDECAVLESNEDNNLSGQIEANPIVGFTEVGLERDSVALSSTDSNTANLVTDALFFYGSRVAEEQGAPGPSAAIIDSRALLPPGVDPGELIGPGDLHAVDLVDLAPSGRLVFVETADAMTLASGFEQGAAKAPTADFLHVSESSFYDYCTGGDRTGLDDLVLGGETLVSSGTVFEIAPLQLLATDPVASLLGVPVDLDSPRLAEILRVYIVEGLGKFVSSQQYPEGGNSRYSQGDCID